MDVNMFIQIVNGVGFPIAACIGMGFFIVWDKKNRREDMKQNSLKQQELLEKLSESVDNNTKMVEQLVEKLDNNKE